MAEEKRLKKESCIYSSYRDWKILPSDTLGTISEWLDILGQINFRAVCKSWNMALADGHYRPKAPQEPWLLVSTADNDDDSANIGFLGGGNNKLYMKFEKPAGHHLGVKGGEWLVTLSPYLEETIIWNPIICEVRHFPSILSLPGSERFFGSYRWCRLEKSCSRYQFFNNAYKGFIDNIKPFVSSDLSNHGDVTIMIAIVIYYPNSLAFAREGDASWTPFNNGLTSMLFEDTYLDVALYRGDIYAVRGDGVVTSWDITRGGNSSTELSITWPANMDYCNCITYRKCFAASSSRLLLIWSSIFSDAEHNLDAEHIHLENVNNDVLELDHQQYNLDDENNLENVTNDVLELDHQTKQWRPIRSLGNGSIFINNFYDAMHMEGYSQNDNIYLSFLSCSPPYETFFIDYKRLKGSHGWGINSASRGEVESLPYPVLGYFVPAPPLMK